MSNYIEMSGSRLGHCSSLANSGRHNLKCDHLMLLCFLQNFQHYALNLEVFVIKYCENSMSHIDGLFRLICD